MTTLRRLGGAARTSQLLRAGVSAAEIGDAWATGRIDRLRKGVYALDAREPVAIAARHGGLLTCVSALGHHGVWTQDDGRVHVEVGRTGRVHPHTGCTCLDHHTHAAVRFGIASVEIALVTAAHCLDEENLFAAFESAVRQGFLGGAARTRVVQALPERLRPVVEAARDDADSGLESIFRWRLMLVGIGVECQVYIPGIGRVDFRCGRVLFEVDGRLNHDGRSRRHNDLLRDAAAARLGYVVLRFDYEMVMNDWPTVLAAILGALASA